MSDDEVLLDELVQKVDLLQRLVIAQQTQIELIVLQMTSRKYLG